MRDLLTELKGTLVHLSTTHGHTHIGTILDVLDEVVVLRLLNGSTRVHMQYTDISGVQPFEHQEDG